MQWVWIKQIYRRELFLQTVRHAEWHADTDPKTESEQTLAKYVFAHKKNEKIFNWNV